MIYTVMHKEKDPHWANVEAESEAEAIEKAKRGDIIEGTQDSEPGEPDMRSFRVIDNWREISG